MSRLLLAISWASLAGCSGGLCEAELPYDGVDQDCDGSDLVDVDGDGFDGSQVGGPDCDDSDPDIHPDQVEIPYDTIDQDCSGQDLVDADGDGYNHNSKAIGGDDCDDDDPNSHPGADDTVGDTFDQNCDGLDGVDFDADGFASLSSGGNDCDDTPTGGEIHPGAKEIWYDSIDQNCNQDCDYDQDGDGFLLQSFVPGDNSPCDSDPKYSVIEFAADCNDTIKQATDNFLIDTVPSAGDDTVYGGLPLRVQFTRPEGGATMAVTDDKGNPVTGTARFEGNDLVFYPSEPLATHTVHDTTVTWSCGTAPWTFTTGPYSGPVSTTQLADTVFEIDLSATFVQQPLGFSAELQKALDRSWLLWVDSVNSSSISLVQASANVAGTEQDVCIETADFGASSFTNNPEVSTGAADVLLPLATGPAPVYGATLDGLVSEAADQFGKGVLQGEIDTRDFLDALAPGGDDDALCDLEAKFGTTTCGACTDGSGDYCLNLLMRDVSGVSSTATVVERSAADIAADGTCSP